MNFARYYSLIGILLLCSAAVQAQHSDTYTANGKTVGIDTLNKDVEYMMNDVGIPGLSVAIIDHGRIVFYHTYGVKDWGAKKEEKVNRETTFEACSLSKIFLVYVAHEVAGRGLLDLDKPLYEYLPDDDLMHDSRYKLITARMVLSHISGIENHKEGNNPKVLEIVSDPGKAFVYSGEGYLYLARVISKILGMSVEAYIDKLVIEPLKLRRTYTDGTKGSAAENYATGHDAFGKSIYKERVSTPDLASRVYTDAQDYAKMVIALFDGRHVPRSEITEMLKPSIKIPIPDDIYHGAGFELYYSPAGDTLVLQGGDNNGFKGLVAYSVVKQCGIVYFANADRAEKIGTRLCELTTGMDINPFYNNLYNNVWPSAANTLLHIYKVNGLDSMRKRFDAYMEAGPAGGFSERDMVELVFNLKDREYQTAKYIAVEYRKRYPDPAYSFVFDRWIKN